MFFLKAILGFFTGGGAGGIANALRQAHKDRLDAANDKDRLDAEERTETLMLRMEAQTRGAGSWLPKITRAAFAAPFVLYNAKLVVYDKVLKMGATDSLSPELIKIEMLIIGFYFLDATIHKMRA